ncbi:exosome 3'-_5 exonuclease subunit ski4 (Csl4) [Arachnomyces sp. PD_36]|nr:exosome 3'->5 exonuclease subunit ski4 (Csl4) [Arachnomyces sp. PD_36]
MTAPIPNIAVPGQPLGPSTSYTSGPGTHIQNSQIYASIAGPVFVDNNPEQQTKTKSKPNRPTLTVSRTYRSDARRDGGRAGEAGAGASMNGGALRTITSTATATTTTTGSKQKKEKFNTLPAVDSTVLARVTRVQKRQATVSILVVLPDTSEEEEDPFTPAALPPTTDELRFQALIRKEDVRLVERDRVVMDEMFRVGDIVRGTVISLGDQSNYYLSTARNELGVVMARSEVGNMMFPVSWKEMRDPVTGVGEGRKVAKPF